MLYGMLCYVLWVNHEVVWNPLTLKTPIDFLEDIGRFVRTFANIKWFYD